MNTRRDNQRQKTKNWVSHPVLCFLSLGGLEEGPKTRQTTQNRMGNRAQKQNSSLANSQWARALEDWRTKQADSGRRWGGQRQGHSLSSRRRCSRKLELDLSAGGKAAGDQDRNSAGLDQSQETGQVQVGRLRGQPPAAGQDQVQVQRRVGSEIGSGVRLGACSGGGPEAGCGPEFGWDGGWLWASVHWSLLL